MTKSAAGREIGHENSGDSDAAVSGGIAGQLSGNRAKVDQLRCLTNLVADVLNIARNTREIFIPTRRRLATGGDVVASGAEATAILKAQSRVNEPA